MTYQHSPEAIAKIITAKQTWTPEADDLVIALWGMGKSASEIAQSFPGKTRSAVIGRVARLRGRGASLAARAPRQGGGRKPRTEPLIRLKHPPLLNKPLPPIVDTLDGAVTLMELTGCKWPVNHGGPFLFCNRPRRKDSSYCEGHLARNVAPRTDRHYREAVDSAHKSNFSRM